MISCDVDGPFFCDVATDPQRIADRNVVATVRRLWWWSVFVRDNRFAAYVHSHGTVNVNSRWMRYNHCSAHVVLICITTNDKFLNFLHKQAYPIFKKRRMSNTHQLRVGLRSGPLYLPRRRRPAPRQYSLRPLSRRRRRPHRVPDCSIASQ